MGHYAAEFECPTCNKPQVQCTCEKSTVMGTGDFSKFIENIEQMFSENSGNVAEWSNAADC